MGPEMFKNVWNKLIQSWDHFGNTLALGPNMVTYSHIDDPHQWQSQAIVWLCTPRRYLWCRYFQVINIFFTFSVSVQPKAHPQWKVHAMLKVNAEAKVNRLHSSQKQMADTSDFEKLNLESIGVSNSSWNNSMIWRKAFKIWGCG